MHAAGCRPKRSSAGSWSRPAPGGEVVYLRDVARIELGPETYALRSMLDGRASVGIPVFQLPGANALELSAAVRQRDGRAGDSAFPTA